MPQRPLGTMITYGYAGIALESELELATQFGARVLEILPNWRTFPDPAPLLAQVADRGMSIHSAHGCWGSRSIKALRVDLGQPDEVLFRQSVDDLKWCVDWLMAAGG
ncbi:MAG TPA: sugar phosphate isomerase/epimerase, partial [Isosphaeraceae bacterium]|nr:sugar phosphate isomerase/epimerase [Isosphaeraceae bacterium]